MEGTHVNYLGRVVPIEGFRAFVYSPDGSMKVVNSWAAYEEHIATGVWFPTLEATRKSVVKDAPKPFKAKGKTGITLGMPANDAGHVQILEGTVELVRDDFLPNESA